jgi:hypothetical protein
MLLASGVMAVRGQCDSTLRRLSEAVGHDPARLSRLPLAVRPGGRVARRLSGVRPAAATGEEREGGPRVQALRHRGHASGAA